MIRRITHTPAKAAQRQVAQTHLALPLRHEQLQTTVLSCIEQTLIQQQILEALRDLLAPLPAIFNIYLAVIRPLFRQLQTHLSRARVSSRMVSNAILAHSHTLLLLAG